MSIECINFAIKAKTERASDKLILILLANYASANNLAFPCVERLALESCLDRKTVFTALKRLVASGLISETGKKIGSTGSVKIYKLSSTENGTASPKSSTENGHKQYRKRYSSSTENGTHNHHLTNINHKDLLDNKSTPEIVSQKLNELNDLFKFRRSN